MYHIYYYILIHSNLFLYNYLKHQTENNSAIKNNSLDVKRERKRNFVSAKVGFLAVIVWIVSVVFYIIFYRFVILIYKARLCMRSFVRPPLITKSIIFLGLRARIALLKS